MIISWGGGGRGQDTTHQLFSRISQAGFHNIINLAVKISRVILKTAHRRVCLQQGKRCQVSLFKPAKHQNLQSKSKTSWKRQAPWSKAYSSEEENKPEYGISSTQRIIPDHYHVSLPPPPKSFRLNHKDRINLSYPVISGTQCKSQTALTKNTMSQTFARETHLHSVRNVLCPALPPIHRGAQTRGHPCAEAEAPTAAMLAEQGCHAAPSLTAAVYVGCTAKVSAEAPAALSSPFPTLTSPLLIFPLLPQLKGL